MSSDTGFDARGFDEYVTRSSDLPGTTDACLWVGRPSDGPPVAASLGWGTLRAWVFGSGPWCPGLRALRFVWSTGHPCPLAAPRGEWLGAGPGRRLLGPWPQLAAIRGNPGGTCDSVAFYSTESLEGPVPDASRIARGQIREMPRRSARSGFLSRLPADWATPPTPSAMPEATSRTPRTRTSTTTPTTTTSTMTPARSVDGSGPARSADGPAPAHDHPRLAPRRDAPMVALNSKIGSQIVALASADDDTAKEETLANYEARTMATSSVAPHAARWATWTKMHHKWFGTGPGALPVLPLTPESLRAVAAMLIAGGYRSCGHYVSRAKDEHTKSWAWSSMLAREQRRANLAARRGMGPAHQSAELPLHAVVELGLGTEQLTQDGPIDFASYVILAAFFVLREIEASLMLCSSVTLNKEQMKVTIELPTCKTDPGALACSRTWGCVCDGDRSQPCAFHAADDHLTILFDRFAVDGALPRDLPFFPGATGEPVDKIAVVHSVEAVAGRLGLPLKSADGRNAFGGHVFRVSGARHLAAVGVDPRVIMVHARWQTNVILRYVQEAPLATLTDTYRRLTTTQTTSTSSSSSSTTAVTPLTPQVAARVRISEAAAERARKIADDAVEATDALKTEMAATKEALEELRRQVLPKYIISRYGATHIAGNAWCHLPQAAWKAACGWTYGGSSFHRSPVPGAAVDQHCPRCFRAAGEAAG